MFNEMFEEITSQFKLPELLPPELQRLVLEFSGLVRFGAHSVSYTLYLR